ncbi:flagellar hook-basal body complex protein [Litoribacillus peritrichatus]|uniref:Flagellar hook protein FlgE n=1 Tax=Litoribacillus peritrichatus TaxID=718191 RepID=A0ABP7M3M5_9GAMM
MSFGVGLTGLKGAQTDLDVTGHNIANAGTTGFKQSRVEFGDLYAANVSGNGASGQGVNINTISQQFNQGDINFTENSLDLAINGEGFFVVQNDLGEQFYTRSGMFSLNNEGFIVTNTGELVQGFGVPEELQLEAAPNPSRPLGDIQVDDADMAPNRTTDVDTALNLDARMAFATGGLPATTNGTGISVAQAGTVNGYSATTTTSTIQLVNAAASPNEVISDISWAANASAFDIATTISNVDGATASASTTLQLTNWNTAQNATLDGLPLTVTDPASASFGSGTALAAEISGRANYSATYDAATDTLTVVNSLGNDVSFAINDAADPTSPGVGSMDVTGVVNGQTVGAAVTTTPGAGNEVTVGGFVDVIVDPGFYIVNNDAATAPNSVVFGATPTNDTAVIRPFSPTDSKSYNHTTSVNIYDSLGNQHVMTQYFVKEPATLNATNTNTWTMYVVVDGENIGDVNPGFDPSQPVSDTNQRNLTLSQTLVFDDRGDLASSNPATPLLVDDWVPRDADGNPNGAAGPVAGEQPTVPPTSSNFTIDITGSTQRGSQFAINSLAQDGFGTGTLVGLDVDTNGQVIGRYTNGETRTFAYVAMANFTNEQGLVPIGDTMWRGSTAAGEAVINLPGTAALGKIQSSALESSNVDLSDELVGLIIAQRNYQANAKTIETENTISQTILNI